MSGSAPSYFLLILFGPYIVFAGAVWTLHPAVQILSSPLVFNYYSTNTDNQIFSGHHMAAFCKAVKFLQRYYEIFPPQSELANILHHSTVFPHSTSFILQ
ncbi:uncharacterized protein F5891DRAFT_1183589 [Suillus fuscotomentosus]|uniref:Uncharacterized protein n=1 Tax=Suillus fuscotomentosus TaxID=1912939 RepID=A0AAD4HQL0_9AGAM|nr:uncharacterized protein F5891DRAFT_1183589 [Suillus fuscotomentosus]KAG1904946.1 hypothetical protein F5891DRAFT_1183589 [Suillus fuscotomentosus]